MSDTLLLAPQMTELARLASWSEAFAETIDLPATSRYALQLCLEEQVSNIVRHCDATAPIRVTLTAMADSLVATVADQGTAFNPLDGHARDRPEGTGGLGLGLMRAFAGEIGYERRDGENRLVLRFRR